MTQRIAFAMLLASIAGAAEIGQLSWMSGCWARKTATSETEEQWMSPSGGSMLGMSRTVRSGKTVFSEFLRIDEKAGEIVYTARPGNQAPTPFKMIKLSASEVVFENPDHDFPQRIIYRVVPDGLHARIEGKDKNGKEGSQDFPFKRTKCP